MGVVVVPVADHHVRPARHARMNRILPHLQAEEGIIGIGGLAPDDIAGVNILYGKWNIF